MIISNQHLFARKFRDPEPGDDGAGDRGDDFEATDEDAADAAARLAATEAAADKKPAAKEPVKDPKKEVKADATDEVDEEGEEGKDKDDKKGRKDDRVPLSRHKAVLQKEREAREAAEKKLAQYEGGDRIAVINEDLKKAEDRVAAMDEEHAKLITDGEHEKAAAKMREIRALERKIGDQKADLRASAATSMAVEKMRYDTVVERLEAAYPVLNPDDDDHDADKAQDVLDLARTYQGRGLTPAEAIQKAAKTLLGAETAKQTAAVVVKPRVDAEEAEAAAAKETKEAERKKAAVTKNLDTSKRQPADTSKVGADSDKAGGSISSKDVLKMSHEDFVKLDEKTLSALRGDTFADA